MSLIIVRGLASKKEIHLNVSKNQTNLTLLEFLTQEGLPIASSCRGQGSCKKCVFNIDELSCQEVVSNFIGKKVSIDYL